jgi:hypothetical protein
MFNYKQTLETMRKERASLQAELEKLDRAISALASVVGGAVAIGAKQPAKKRQQVLQPQKQQPTKLRSKGSQSSKSKGKISAEGLRNIIEAQKRRWAKVRAAAKTKAKASAA